MKSNFIFKWILGAALILSFAAFKSKAPAVCKFIGCDNFGNPVFHEDITCDFPVLMGHSVVDSVSYQNEWHDWLAAHPNESAFTNYYFQIPWYNFIQDSEERQAAMKDNPDMYRIIPRDYMYDN